METRIARQVVIASLITMNDKLIEMHNWSRGMTRERNEQWSVIIDNAILFLTLEEGPDEVIVS